MHSRLDSLAIGLGLDVEQDRCSGLEQLARGRKRLREHHRFELAGRVGEGDEGVSITGLALPLARMKDGRGERADDAAGARLARELCPSLGAKVGKNVLIVVEGMAGEKESDRLELTA